METAATTVIQSPFVSHRPSQSFPRSAVFPAQISNFARFNSKFVPSIKHASLISHPALRQRRVSFHSRRSLVVRAAWSSPESGGSLAQIAPLQLESPVGQFLSQILISHPHLVPAAVDQQLEQLQTDRDAEKKEEQSASGTDIVLYRISEVKNIERRMALEEILYTLIVQKFMDANVTLVPAIGPSSTDASGQINTWPTEEVKKLEQLHSHEAYEMIQNHLALILGNRLDDSTSVAQISKLRVGQVYAASVMYGYFLKRVDQRFQLEKAVKTLPSSSEEEQSTNHQDVGEGMEPYGGEESLQSGSFSSGVSSQSGGNSSGDFSHGIKASRLRSYVMSFDGETLQRYATIRSKEAVTIIEKHTEALFARPEIILTPQRNIDSSKDELIKISFGGLKRLVLEAVTFGSFLWDVESYVDSRYHFVMN